MSEKREREIRQEARKYRAGLDAEFERRVPVACPCGFWRRVLWFFRPSVKVKHQERWGRAREKQKVKYMEWAQKATADYIRLARTRRAG